MLWCCAIISLAPLHCCMCVRLKLPTCISCLPDCDFLPPALPAMPKMADKIVPTHNLISVDYELMQKLAFQISFSVVSALVV